MAFALSKAILYPGIKIRVAAPSLKQAVLLIKNYDDLKQMSPILSSEIKDYTTNKDGGIITLKNGSTISTVVCSSNARGERCQVLILDEVRGMDQDIVNEVFTPFLSARRKAPFVKLPQYRHALDDEPNIQIEMTSIGTKEEWIYKRFCNNSKIMSSGSKEYSVFSIPYQFGLESSILVEKTIERQVRENQNNLSKFSMEMECIPFGESEFSLFKFEDLNKSRKINLPLIPVTNEEYIEIRGDLRKSEFYQSLLPHEIRVVSMDIAVAAGKKNDNSVITVFRLFENGDYYEKNISYMEVMNGVNIDDQMLRLKQVFYDLECTYTVIDAGGALGNIAANILGDVTYDIQRNRYYPGWKTIDGRSNFDLRAKDPNAVPVLYCLQVAGGSATTLQYNMLIGAQVEFQRKRIKLLIHEDDAVEMLNKGHEYLKLSTSNFTQDKIKANNMILPFINITKMVEEAITTQAVRLGSGRYGYDEKNGRKDRVISVIYGLYFISQLEIDLSTRNNEMDIHSYFNKPVVAKNATAVRNPFMGNIGKLKGFGKR